MERDFRRDGIVGNVAIFEEVIPNVKRLSKIKRVKAPKASKVSKMSVGDYRTTKRVLEVGDK